MVDKQPRESIYVLGASGFIGGHLTRYFRGLGYPVFTERVEVTDIKALRESFKARRPDIVINCAGVRAHPNIDWCEDHISETILVNVNGAVNVMLAALEAGAYPIQMASGCIYNGGPVQPFTEEDPPNFSDSLYSRMRIRMQDLLKELSVLQARIRIPIAFYAHPRNSLTKIAGYKRLISVPNSVTLLEDLGPALEIAIAKRITGILNLTNDGWITHRDLLYWYKQVVDPAHQYELISVEELEKNIVKAGRSNCVLSTELAKSHGISMPALDDERLEKLMVNYKTSLTRGNRA